MKVMKTTKNTAEEIGAPPEELAALSAQIASAPPKVRAALGALADVVNDEELDKVVRTTCLGTMRSLVTLTRVEESTPEPSEPVARSRDGFGRPLARKTVERDGFGRPKGAF